MMDSRIDLLKLAALMKPAGEGDESDTDDECKNTIASMGPADVGKKTIKSPETSSKPHLTTIKKQTKDIWDLAEVTQGSEFNDQDDPRPEPKYEMVYKQAVTTEDMFLQLGNKTCATASCENLVVKIHLPGSRLSDINLDVKESFLDCRTPKYKLGLYLPHPNDPNVAKAKWDSKDESLSVTLTLLREFDDFNF